MQQNHTEILLQQTISPQLSVNLSKIRTIAEGSSDLLVNEFVLSGLPAALLCCEGMLHRDPAGMSHCGKCFRLYPESPAVFYRPCRGKHLC